MSKDNQKLIPNSTQTPNILSDFLMPNSSDAEWKCVSYICRRTFGFHKDEDRISLSQFIHGLKTRDGKVLDEGTGLSKQSVASALKALAYAGAILVKKDNQGNYYQINLSMDIHKVVKKLDQSRILTASGLKNRPKQGKIFDTQKKEKQRETKQSVFKKNAVELLVDYYFELKGWDDQPKQFYITNKISYGRNCKTAKQILSLFEDDLVLAKERVDKIHKWAEGNGLEWSLETIIKRFLEK